MSLSTKDMGIPISIIVPIYNAEKHLDYTLHSIRAQTIQDIEIIAVDDGSTDQSSIILEKHAKEDKRLVVIRQENQGVSATRNKGLDSSKGKWVTFVDSDDYLAPRALETYLELAENQALDLLIGNAFRFTYGLTPSKSHILDKQNWNQVLTGMEWIERSTEQREWPHYVWLQFIRRELIQKHKLRFKKNIVHEDIVWTSEVAIAAQRVGFNQESLYGYRVHPSSIMNRNDDDNTIHRANSYLIVIQHLAELAKTKNTSLNKALLRQANLESGYFARLVKKRVQCKQAQKDLASSFIKNKTHRIAFKGVKDSHDFWRALRFWIELRILAFR